MSGKFQLVYIIILVLSMVGDGGKGEFIFYLLLPKIDTPSKSHQIKWYDAVHFKIIFINEMFLICSHNFR